jgi:hypothetical protein
VSELGKRGTKTGKKKEKERGGRGSEKVEREREREVKYCNKGDLG